MEICLSVCPVQFQHQKYKRYCRKSLRREVLKFFARKFKKKGTMGSGVSIAQPAMA
jgi:hypothetical protein